jgi:hypothetical protein
MRAFAVGIAVAVGLASCHPPAEQPPFPPRPTDPTNGQAIAEAVIDASIISDAGPSLDGIDGVESASPTAR